MTIFPVRPLVAQFQRGYLSCMYTKAREEGAGSRGYVALMVWKPTSSRTARFIFVGRKKGDYFFRPARIVDPWEPEAGKIGSRFFAEGKKAKE